MCNAPPSLCLRDVTIESLAAIGNDRHLKMRISKDGQYLDCIFFMVTLKDLGMKVGTQVDIAFEPGINDFRGVRSVQLLLKDVRAARRFNDQCLSLQVIIYPALHCFLWKRLFCFPTELTAPVSGII